MRLESLAIRLLTTLSDNATCRVNPLDFTALLYLRDRGFADVSVKDGCVVAERTVQGRQFANDRRITIEGGPSQRINGAKPEG
jgi:hypothetical protein